MEIPIVSVTFLLPLALMVFCYSRIVHALRTKVTHHNHGYLLCFDLGKTHLKLGFKTGPRFPGLRSTRVKARTE